MKQLTEAGIDRLKKAEKGRRLHVFDSKAPGLAVRVTDKGAKSYVVVTRLLGSGRQVWVTLKLRPGPGTLTSARKQAGEIVAWAGEGRDPRRMIAAREAEALKETETTVSAVFDRYMVRFARERKPATVSKVRAVFAADVLPALGEVPIGDVTRADILTLLDLKADAGHGVAANRLRAYLRAFFEYARERDLITQNVVSTTSKPAKERARERALSDAELRAVWVAAETLPWQACAAVRLLVLLGQRPNEVAGMRWAEIDRATWTWRLPGARTKNGKDHEIAIPDFAADLIEGLPRFAGSDQVLGSNRKRGAHVSLGSKLKALIDARLEDLAEKGEGVPVAPWQWRDLRRSAATGMERIGVSPRIVAAILNHSPPGLGVTAVYARHEYRQEAADALQRWAAHIGDVVRVDGVAVVAEAR